MPKTKKETKPIELPKVGDLIARMGINGEGYVLGEIVEIKREELFDGIAHKNSYRVIWNESDGPVEETHKEGYVRSAAWSMKLYREVHMMED